MEFVGLFLDKAKSQPLYHQLYSFLAAQVRAGRIGAGERLPGKRTAAAQLGVSVNTVDEAYQMLASEGYVEARPRSGFIVSEFQQVEAASLGLQGAAAGGMPMPGAAVTGDLAPGAAQPLLAGLSAEEQASPGKWRFSFASGDIDPTLFPRKAWARTFREVLAQEEDLYSQGEPAGEAALREAVAAYLRGWRGVRCEAGQVVLGAGLEVLYGMLGRLFPSTTVALEDPGYPKTAAILRNVGVQTCPVPVDEGGMCPELLLQCGAAMAYLTPSHQFPTGGAMPASRRSALLRWAANGERLLIEDDYDSEFRFDGRPLPCLQGLDEGGRVVYAGTFSRSLAPGLRAAYLVLPPAVLARWQAAYGSYACTVARPEQYTLARFMAQGHFSRSLNRMRAAYRRRRDLLLQALAACLPDGSYTVENAHTGLYFILHLPAWDARVLAQKARGQGIRIRAVDDYRFPSEQALLGQSGTANALVVGYGGLRNEFVPDAAEALAALLY